MTRYLISVTLTLSLISTLTRAANPVFGTYTTPSCDTCLDQTFLSCPGDYHDRDYGTCMCYGDGGTNVNTCLSYCDTSLNEPANVVATWYGYCVIFFKDMCADAANYISQSRFEDECSPEAIAAGGVGEEQSGSGSGSASGSDSSATATGDGYVDYCLPGAGRFEIGSSNADVIITEILRIQRQLGPRAIRLQPPAPAWEVSRKHPLQ
jgi:hypothetical protein